MTESEIKLVERLWASGKGVGEIARLLPYKEYIAKQEIRELKRNGVLKGKSGKSQANTQAKVLQAYNDGITSPYDLAEMFGVCYGYVNNILSSAISGRQRPKRNYKQRKVCENTQAIITALRSGKRVREICNEFGVSTQYVYQVKDKFVKEQQNER
jgi:transposase